MKKQNVYDVAILGGGVVGCAIFNALARSGYKVVLLEKATDIATGTTKANSGLVHAGFDAKPNTLKARFNVEGNKLYPAMCKRLNVPLKKVGAYVVGDDIKVINALYQRGIQNGVEGMEVLNQQDLKTRIPNLNKDVKCGLFCKNAYVVSPYLLTICLAEEGIVNGGNVQLNYNANCIKYEDFLAHETFKDGVWRITDGNTTYFAKNIVNSAGNSYNEVAKLIGSEQYNIVFKRGEYFVLDHSEHALVNSTIFPLPSEHGKGILVTPTVDGNILVGPTSYESDVSTKTTKAGLNSITEKSATLVDGVNTKKAIRTFAGVRAVVGDDFVIEKSKLVPSVINLAGICSPGLSSAPAIAKYVVKLMGLKYNPKVNTNKITPYTNLKDVSEKQKNVLISQNSAYGKIICKCENISEGEIIDAINRPLRCTTTDGIKRRIRAGMGRCQGTFCLDRVISVLAKQNKVPFDSVQKEYAGSEIVVASIKEGKQC